MTAATWITALFGLLGTVGGSAATVIGQRICTAAQQRQAACERAQRVADLRHDAAVALLARADALLEDVRLLHAVRGGAAEFDALHPRYMERWRAFTTSRAAVRLAGPDSLSRSGAELRDALLAMSDVVDAWQQGRSTEPGGYERVHARADAAREEFADEARSVLHEALART